MTRLFEPIEVSGLRLANRIVIAPMCQYSAVDGAMTDWHRMHLGQLALSGAGALTIAATAVSPGSSRKAAAAPIPTIPETLGGPASMRKGGSAKVVPSKETERIMSPPPCQGGMASEQAGELAEQARS